MTDAQRGMFETLESYILGITEPDGVFIKPMLSALAQLRTEWEALGEIITERERQDIKWGEQNHHAYKWMAILIEEVGEVGKAILENDPSGYKKELVEVAAVAIAAGQSFERYGMIGKDDARLTGMEKGKNGIKN